MPRSSARRGQVEPLAALAALVVLGAALTTYAVAYRDALPDARDRNLARPALSETLAGATPGATLLPDRLQSAAESAAPAGYRLNATVRTGNRTWSVGPTPPPAPTESNAPPASNAPSTPTAPNAAATPTPPSNTDAALAPAADVASRAIPVRVAPGRVRPGRLRVVVWR